MKIKVAIILAILCVIIGTAIMNRGDHSVDASQFLDSGDTWLEKVEYDKAIEDYSEAIRIDPKNVRAYYKRGQSFFMKGTLNKSIDEENLNRAIDDLTEVIRLDQEHSDAYASRGNTWFTLKKFDEAISDFNEAIQLNPKDFSSLNYRGFVRRLKNEHEKAISDFDEAIKVIDGPFKDFTGFHHRHLIKIFDGVQAVSHRDQGAFFLPAGFK